ncbi:Rieske 2Fe-2S domain-containing protein [Panacibacter ginsenosidivorans]|uniref:Rieske 2Fe-2S domain-containing protein n=1 Tax=Panacibacter ginsenosidivorans TaxID=1813871 RepID=A0A5B8VAR0_9BACT|nr:Rieske 2Fe-2S domain-containing protein [Panacibacter ginsenosidivorans]QEC68215.1 Rieske 2Fe-2S domain-containing protein [Panacibacter ginsenosidivorans]
MREPKYIWYKIAESENELHFNNNNLIVAIANKKKITIGKFKEKLLACSYNCPHAGGILSDGHIDAQGNIVCPLHHYRFNMVNGHNITGEGYFLKTYPVEVREDGVYIGMEEKKLFSFL